MTQRLDTERAALLTTLARDSLALSRVKRAAITALLAIRRTAVPLASLEEPLTAIVGALEQASADASGLIHELNALAWRIERDEATGHELAHILARPHYLHRGDYLLWPRSSRAPVPGPGTNQ